jgi:hypothetical protein
MTTIRPIPPRPVRTVNDYRKRLAAEKRAALHARLAREIEQKGKGNDASR